MIPTIDVLHELREGWRIVVPFVIAQLLGAVLLIVVGWPGFVGLMPEVPAFVFQFWLGAAFALPFGFLAGISFQQSSGRRASRPLVWFCAAAAVVLPLVGVGLLGT